MKKNTQTKKELINHVAQGLRQYGISSALFRHAVAKQVGLNITDMECLGLLFHKGIATPSELCKYTGLTSGAATAMLDRLEKNNLIKRQPNPNDRRGSRIIINKSGAAKIAPYFLSIREAQDKLLASYSADELRPMAAFLNEITELWDKEYSKL